MSVVWGQEEYRVFDWKRLRADVTEPAGTCRMQFH